MEQKEQIQYKERIEHSNTKNSAIENKKSRRLQQHRVRPWLEGSRRLQQHGVRPWLLMGPVWKRTYVIIVGKVLRLINCHTSATAAPVSESRLCICAIGVMGFTRRRPVVGVGHQS